MTAILGISAFYHDSAAALVVDGRIIAAAQEERFSRQKHDASFPRGAIDYCLAAGGLRPDEVDYVAYYEKPFTKFERLMETHVAFAPRGYRAFRRAMPMWLSQKLPLSREIRRGLRDEYRGAIAYVEHHQSHAASAFFPSPFHESAIVTIDGVGEWSTTTIGRGAAGRVELLEELRFPHSLGLLYSAFTYYLGFRVNSGEYKVMGLAPYGQPCYVDLILSHLIDLKEDGSFRLDMTYFDYGHGLRMTSRKFERLFGGPPRTPESELTQRHLDLAASIQSVAGEVMLRIVRRALAITGSHNLVLAGGVALNCVANSRLATETPLENIWIQPAAGDAGGALGAAQFVWYQLLEEPRAPATPDGQAGSLLGPCFSDAQVGDILDACGAVYTRYADEDQLLLALASLLDQQRIVGWFQGRMEFGPRALGARSILADPRSATMQSLLNEKIKLRESFRPFAPSVLLERSGDYFQLPKVAESPYMLLTARVAPGERLPLSEEDSQLRGLDQRLAMRSTIPAVTHVDDSARVQTVDAVRNPRFHRLLTRWLEQSGCPVLINTSFNVRGEPLVCTPLDAYRCFMATDIDVLAIESYVLLKNQQPASMQHRAPRTFAPD